ncbi:hypothetical protein EDB85DRAFT_2187021 [Lactarius pseudohatsudake]|nr:hypothetical protein EDB85DRAFT_2187021 [Lactarius pseudohatsudake]
MTAKLETKSFFSIGRHCASLGVAERGGNMEIQYWIQEPESDTKKATELKSHAAQEPGRVYHTTHMLVPTIVIIMCSIAILLAATQWDRITSFTNWSEDWTRAAEASETIGTGTEEGWVEDIRKGAAAASCVAIPLALADASQACCKRKVGQGGSGEPPPSRGSVATSGWTRGGMRVDDVFISFNMVAYARTRGRPCLTDIVFDTVNRMARLPEMTFTVTKNWEMSRFIGQNPGALDPTKSFVRCVGDSTNLKSSDGHPARPQVTISGFEFQAPRPLPDGPRVVLHSAGATYKRRTQAMVIHRRTPRNIPTIPYMVSGYVWQRWPRRRITSTFVAVSSLRGYLIDTPYVNIEREFFLPRASPPEVYDMLVQVSCYKLLVTGYLNSSLGPNPNCSVIFLSSSGKSVSLLPSKFGIYMEVCIAHAEVGSPFLSYIKRSFGLATVQAEV